MSSLFPSVLPTMGSLLPGGSILPGRSQTSRRRFGSSAFSGSGLSDLDPEQLLDLQRQLAMINLGQEPKPRGGGGFLGFLGRGLDLAVPDIAGQALREIATALMYTPFGLFEMGKAGVLDTRDLLSGDFDTPWSRQANIVLGMGRGLAEDIQHPLRHPGYTAMDLFGGASLIAGAGGRVVRASRAADEGTRIVPDEPLLPPGATVPRGPTPPRTPPTRPELRLEEIPSSFTPRTSGLQRDLQSLAEEVADPAAHLLRPGRKQAIADQIAERIRRERPSPTAVTDLMSQLGAEGSPRIRAMQQEINFAFARTRPATTEPLPVTLAPPRETPPLLTQEPAPGVPPAARPAPPPQGAPLPQAIAGVLDPTLVTPQGVPARVRVTGPFTSARVGRVYGIPRGSTGGIERLLRELYPKGVPSELQKLAGTARAAEGALPLELENILDELMQPGVSAKLNPLAQEFRQIPGEVRPIEFTELMSEFSRQGQSPERLAQLRAIAEGSPSGLKAQRQALAREVTGAADEAAKNAKYLEDVGAVEFKDVRRFDDEEVRNIQRLYTVRPAMQYRSGQFSGRRIPGHGQVRDPEGRATGVTYRVSGTDEQGTPVFRVWEGNERVSPAPIKGEENAIRLAKIYAAERKLGTPQEATSLVRGEQTLVRLADDSIMTVQEAIEESLRRRYARRQEGKRKEEAELEDDDFLPDELEEEQLPDEVDDMLPEEFDDETALPEDMDPNDLPSARAGVHPDTPIEETPAPSRSQTDHVKAQVPEEIHDLVDEVVRDVTEMPGERSLGTSPRSQGTSPRILGESDRELGIAPKAAKRAGLTAAQTNALRGPLQELREGGKVLPGEVEGVIKDTLGVSDEEAARIFEAMTRPESVMGKGDVELAKGSLRQHFQKLGLDETQLDQAINRFKEVVGPYMQELKASGRGPRKADLIPLLKQAYGDEFGMRVFDRLYRPRGGSSESWGQIFMREFFKPEPRQRFLLEQDLVSKERVPGPAVKTGRYRTEMMGGEEVQVPVMRTKTELRDVTRREGVLIDLSKNPIRRGFQRWLYEWMNKGKPGTFAARQRERKFKFERDEKRRIEGYLQTAGMSVSERDRLLQERAGNEKRTFGDWVDTGNQLSSILVLYAKPAYLPPNLLGQILFSLIDHTWNPLAIARSAKLHRQVADLPDGKQLVELYRAGMGSGMYEGLNPGRGAVKSVARGHSWVSRQYGKVLDNPFRDTAFMNAAWKLNYRTPEQIRELVLAQPGSQHWDNLLSAYQDGSRNMVDYGRLNSIEKRYIRRAVFFYPWIKGSTIWAARAASEHPGQMLAGMQLGRIAADKAESVLGPVPSYMAGILPVGERDVPGLGKMPTVINPASFSVTGSAAEFLNALNAFAFGGTSSEQLSEYLSPLAGSALAATTRVDPFTGRSFEQGQSWLDIFASQMTEDIPLTRALRNVPGLPEATGITPGKEGLFERGELDPAETLLPSTRGEELARFVGGVTPMTYNIVEGQSRAQAEQKELGGKAEGINIKWKTIVQSSATAAKEVGETLPPYVQTALRDAARRDREYELVKQNVGRTLTQVDRLRADLGLLVRDGKFAPDVASKLLQQYAALSDSDISNFRRKLREAYFGTAALYEYRSRLQARGVDPKLLAKWSVS